MLKTTAPVITLCFTPPDEPGAPSRLVVVADALLALVGLLLAALHFCGH